MLQGADINRFVALQKSLDEGAHILVGRDEYPKTTTGVYNLLQRTSGTVDSNRQDKKS